MSTIASPTPSPEPFLPETDPFRYGFRYIPRTLENGTVVLDQMPLQPEDLLFPEEGDFHVNSTDHQRDCRYLMDVFEVQLQGVEGAKVFRELRTDWSHPEIRPLGPDIIVISGVHHSQNWPTFKVVDEGATIPLIVEVTSPLPESRKNDVVFKRDFYYQLGVMFYAIVDRQERRGVKKVSVLVYGRGASEYEELPRNEQGRIWLEPVGVWLGVEGNRAMCYRRDGTAIPDLAEIATAAEKRAEAADARAADLEKRLRDMEAELRRSRGEA